MTLSYFFIFSHGKFQGDQRDLVIFFFWKFSIPNKILLRVFLSLLMMNSLNHWNPKLSNKKKIIGCRSRKLHQCVLFLSLRSVFIIINGSWFFSIISWKEINLVTKLNGKTLTIFFLNHCVSFSKKFTIVSLEIPSIFLKKIN